MNPFTRIVITTLADPNRPKREKMPNPYHLAKEWYELKRRFRIGLGNIALILGGIFSATVGLKGFIIPNEFFDGGAMGVSLLLSKLTPYTLSLMVILVNAPFLLLGRKTIGNVFLIKTLLAIGGLSLSLAVVNIPPITDDNILAAIFGGVFLGMGIGFAVRGGAVIDGTEVLAITISRKTRMRLGDVILIINLIIFSAVAYLIDMTTALYSVLTYMAASRTVDYIIEGIEEYTGVTIISHKSHLISQMITDKMGRGMTIYQGGKGFGKQGKVIKDREIIFTVITRLEINRLKTEVKIIDPEAFLVMHSIRDTHGGMIKKRTIKDV